MSRFWVICDQDEAMRQALAWSAVPPKNGNKISFERH
jgi:hypothetical protein